MASELLPAQVEVCKRFGVTPDPPAAGSKLGLALETRSLGGPLKGARDRPEKGTNGWYIFWGEEQSTADDFYQSLHIEHVKEYCALAVPYLALPSGWGFVIAPGYEDVWYGQSLHVRSTRRGESVSGGRALVRRLRRLPRPSVSHAELLDAARAHCEGRGWEFGSSARVQERVTGFTVWVKPDVKGGPYVLLDLYGVVERSWRSVR